ncbi:hypothetical protein A6U87_06085 [Rhizobium sp. AC44/96]|uniref:aldose 1-epimerase n=1 Tax=unclassified Rhizobium TaxID=2613769 RepID=UPI00080FB965|nr:MULTISPECIES: aldose 1-epimerase [unclassified Rhizobium]MDM9623261.1 aldose 1-epimerase [Rhizobium sp. S96]OCJ12876.1 hypothetical protein A6U87_06085 [Rhizobium sp. AC44/96]
MTGDVIRLEKDGLIVKVSPLGGSILSAEWHGIPFLQPAPSPGLASKVLGAEACFPLVPFGNRIENNSFRFNGRDYTLAPNTADPLVLHGDGWLQRWTVEQHTPHRIVLRVSKDADLASPFAYEATETITPGNGQLTIALAVVNRATETLPYGLGFHPYFPRTPETHLFARAHRHWSERENHLPGAVGPIPPGLNFAAGTTLPHHWLNNAFDGWDGQARIEWPETGLALSLTADTLFDRFVVYSPSPHAGFFCFEPMSHQPNGHHLRRNGGLAALAPGRAVSGQLTLSLRSLSRRSTRERS